MRIILFSLISIFCIGCTTGHCVKTGTQLSDHMKAVRAEYVAPPNKERKPVSANVLVFKFDGSKQCQQGNPISVNRMKKELKGIKVFSALKKNDGLMHLTVCGGETGNANVFEINKNDLELAKKRGFKVWRFD